MHGAQRGIWIIAVGSSLIKARIKKQFGAAQCLGSGLYCCIPFTKSHDVHFAGSFGSHFEPTFAVFVMHLLSLSQMSHPLDFRFRQSQLHFITLLALEVRILIPLAIESASSSPASIHAG